MYTFEYFELNHMPVVLVMTTGRRPLQAWRPDKNASTMKRDDSLILDIEDFATPMDRDTFTRYCEAHNIDMTLSARSLQLSYDLAAANETKRTARVVPLFPNSNSYAPAGNIHKIA